jgi:hypothetical protein
MVYLSVQTAIAGEVRARYRETSSGSASDSRRRYAQAAWAPRGCVKRSKPLAADASMRRRDPGSVS